jgi:hypothetical protein
MILIDLCINAFKQNEEEIVDMDKNNQLLNRIKIKDVFSRIVFRFLLLMCMVTIAGCSGLSEVDETNNPAVEDEVIVVDTSTPMPTEIPEGVYIPITNEPIAYVDSLYCEYSKNMNYMPDNWNDIWRQGGFTQVFGSKLLTEVELDKYAVVIFPIPHTDEEEFTQEDVDAVMNYVENGGQIFLIAKYYPEEYGSSTEPSNQISANFGVVFVNEILEATKNGVVSYPVIDSPITRNMNYWVVRHQPCRIELTVDDVQPLLKNTYNQIILAEVNYGHGRAVFLAEMEGLEYSSILLTNLVTWFKPE